VPAREEGLELAVADDHLPEQGDLIGFGRRLEHRDLLFRALQGMDRRAARLRFDL
jgi:hypothetical protein